MGIALVTGSSSGIGLATAVTLARGGHKVIATMRNLDGAHELQKIVAAEKLPVEVAALNVDDDSSVDSAVGKVLAEHGRIDVLVNNAGIGSRGSVEEVPMAVFRQIMETNFFWCAALYQGSNSGHARTSSWLHRQCNLSRRPNGFGCASTLRRFQVGF